MLKLKPGDWMFCPKCKGKLKAKYNPLLRSQKILCGECNFNMFEAYSCPPANIWYTRSRVRKNNAELQRYYKEWEGS